MKANSSSIHHLLPPWQRQYASLCEVRLRELSNAGSPLDPYLGNALQHGRKLRAALALHHADILGMPLEGPGFTSLLDSVSRIEMLHAASCILDDIIDGDTIRRGMPSFHARHGMPAAILSAQELITRAVDTLPSVSMRLIATIDHSLAGEAVDSLPYGVVAQSFDDPERLAQTYLQKTTPSFRFAYESVGYCFDLGASATVQLGALGAAIGSYYQSVNDYYDWFEIAPEARGSARANTLLALSLPVIHALSRDRSLSSLVGAHLPRADLSRVRDRMINLGIPNVMREQIDSVRQDIKGLCSIRPFPPSLNQLLTLFDSREFWSYSYAK